MKGAQPSFHEPGRNETSASCHFFLTQMWWVRTAFWETGKQKHCFRHILHHTVEQGSSCKFSMSASFLFLFCTATVLMLLTSCCFELLRRQPHFAAKLFQVRLARMKQTARLRSTRHNYPDSSCMMSWLQEPLVKYCHVIHCTAYTIHDYLATIHGKDHSQGKLSPSYLATVAAVFRQAGNGTWRLWPRHKFSSFPPRNPAVRIEHLRRQNPKGETSVQTFFCCLIWASQHNLNIFSHLSANGLMGIKLKSVLCGAFSKKVSFEARNIGAFRPPEVACSVSILNFQHTDVY